MSATVFDIGDDAVLETVFLDRSGSPVAPASVVCIVQNGYGTTVATYVAGNGTLALSSPTYSVTQPITASLGWGTWRYRFEGYSPNGAEEFTFYVRDSAFY